ncbi:unnamed protein product [Orchesella dallaii]|uniref:EGF-like domain-containing protein n=1 Tax=Orchesella dallaii TaxID=48710 RepID=A0ABP1S5F4_9HEXA
MFSGVNFFLLGFLTLIIFISEIQGSANYGDTCDAAHRCQSRASLTCNNGTCQCLMPDIMTFNGKKCTVFAGETCTFITVDLQNGNETKRIEEKLPCVSNAICQDGFCICHSNFYEAANRTCIMKGSIGAPCESTLQCDSHNNLMCNSTTKKCECDSVVSTFDNVRNTCLRLVGTPCNQTSGQNQCVQNAECNNGICTCYNGPYFNNTQKQCERKRGYNQPCEDSNYCRGNLGMSLICNDDKRCACNSTISTYEEEQAKCMKIVGAPCSMYDIECTPNSYCYDGYGRRSRKCMCHPGFIKTNSSKCEPRRSFGKTCKSDEQCDTERNLKCSPRGFCECKEDRARYDPKQERCVKLVDELCDYSSNCVFNSICNRQPWLDAAVCECRKYYEPSQDGSCSAPYGKNCGAGWTSQCNRNQGLVCNEGKCTCEYGNLQVYNSTKRKCESLAYGPCDGNIPCAKNSHCLNTTGDIAHCACNPGFVNVNGSCQLKIGRPCGDDGPICDRSRNLKCVDGTCQCGAFEHFDEESEECKGLVGAICSSNGESSYCTNKAVCQEENTGWQKSGRCTCMLGWKMGEDRRCNPIETGDNTDKPLGS